MSDITLANVTDLRSSSSFVIAPSNAINKEKADLILTGVPLADATAINTALSNLLVLDKVIRTSTIQSGSTTTSVILDVDASAVADFYNGYYLSINNEIRLITDYNETTKAVTLVSALSTAPTAGTTYNIKNNIPVNIDFLGGNIDLGTNSLLIPYSNFQFSGNGVNIISSSTVAPIRLYGNNIIFDKFTIYNSNKFVISNNGNGCLIKNNVFTNAMSLGKVLLNAGNDCIIENNYCYANNNSGNYAIYNTGNQCLITNNNGFSKSSCTYNSGIKCLITNNIFNIESGDGINNSGISCIITNNIIIGTGTGIYNRTTDTTNKCIIIGNIITTTNGILLKENTCKPATIVAIEDANIGVATFN